MISYQCIVLKLVGLHFGIKGYKEIMIARQIKIKMSGSYPSVIFFQMIYVNEIFLNDL